jgi:hypothetical protein
MGAENLTPTGIRSPDRPARSEALYRLSYHGPGDNGKWNINYCSVSQRFCLGTPVWFWKITTDPHVLAHVNTVCTFDRYPKFKICISELITVVPPHPLIEIGKLNK